MMLARNILTAVSLSSRIWLINGSSLTAERDSMTAIATFRSASVFSEWGTICARITIPCRVLASSLRTSVPPSFALVIYS